MNNRTKVFKHFKKLFPRLRYRYYGLMFEGRMIIKGVEADTMAAAHIFTVFDRYEGPISLSRLETLVPGMTIDEAVQIWSKVMERGPITLLSEEEIVAKGALMRHLYVGP